jgi:hypothetical protein
VIDSVAALVRKEGLSEVDKETYVVRQVSQYCLCISHCSSALGIFSEASGRGVSVRDLDYKSGF